MGALYIVDLCVDPCGGGCDRELPEPPPPAGRLCPRPLLRERPFGPVSADPPLLFPPPGVCPPVELLERSAGLMKRPCTLHLSSFPSLCCTSQHSKQEPIPQPRVLHSWHLTPSGKPTHLSHPPSKQARGISDYNSWYGVVRENVAGETTIELHTLRAVGGEVQRKVLRCSSARLRRVTSYDRIVCSRVVGP